MEHSHLLSLPKEIRLDIWRYVLTDPSTDKLVLRIRRRAQSPSTSNTRFSNSLYKPTRPALPQIETAFETRRSCPINLNLLVANRSIYEEAIPVLYRSVKFCPQDQGGIFPLFLQGLSSFAQSQIRYIKLYIRHRDNSPFYWAIVCSEIAKLDDSLREVEIEGEWPLTTDFRKRRAILCPLLQFNTPKKLVPAHDSDFQQLLLDTARDRDARAVLQQKASIAATTETEVKGTEDAEDVTPNESRKREYDVQELVIRKKARWDGTPPGTPKSTIASNLTTASVVEQFGGEAVEWDLISLDDSSASAIRSESVVSDDTWTHIASPTAGKNDDDDDDDDDEDWEFLDTLPDTMSDH